MSIDVANGVLELSRTSHLMCGKRSQARPSRKCPTRRQPRSRSEPRRSKVPKAWQQESCSTNSQSPQIVRPRLCTKPRHKHRPAGGASEDRSSPHQRTPLSLDSAPSGRWLWREARNARSSARGRGTKRWTLAQTGT